VSWGFWKLWNCEIAETIAGYFELLSSFSEWSLSAMKFDYLEEIID